MTIDLVAELRELLEESNSWIDPFNRKRDAMRNALHKIEQLRSALLMMKHAYESDNRPNMFLVEEALK